MDGRLAHSESLSGIGSHDPAFIRSRVEVFLDELGEMPGPELTEAVVEELVRLPWSAARAPATSSPE